MPINYPDEQFTYSSQTEKFKYTLPTNKYKEYVSFLFVFTIGLGMALGNSSMHHLVIIMCSVFAKYRKSGNCLAQV